MMGETKVYSNPYKQQFDEAESLSAGKVILGLIASTVIMLASTWGLLTILNFSGVYSFDTSRFLPYTSYMLAASAGSVVLALLLCGILTKWPRTVSLSLHIHRRAKKHSGDYFLSPEPKNETLGIAFRRSLYGSILIVGIALTLLGFELMVELNTGDLIFLGTVLMIVSIVILPFTIMLLYFGPWLLKDSGLFHLDTKDRSLSNVGDDVEDILEFFAGVDIILVWLELTLRVGTEAPWIPIFIIIVSLGPLFSIILNFTIVFMAFKRRSTLSMMRYLTTEFDVPDMASSPDYIRSKVLALVDREMLVTAPSSETASESSDELKSKPESDVEPEPKPKSKRAKIPPPPD
ncbi:MAG: hypothetical protein E3J86_00015 [Candidatus Thorarchaeota archaeon]|nr:MAG: hypothetical protein E3J86_00015 [Candidatus Thorarchaeota archaeon]